MNTHIYNTYNSHITPPPPCIVLTSANLKRLTPSDHCLEIANALLEPFSKITMREQAVATALLSAIAHRVESPFSSRLTKHQIDVAYDSPTQILAIAVWTGIDIRDSHYVNANGYESDVAELFRRITLKVSSEIQDTWLCIDSLDKGLRYITQDLEWLRRTHRNYRIYHNYGVAIKTRATGEWFDQGEDCSTSGYRCGKKGARRRAGRRG